MKKIITMLLLLGVASVLHAQSLTKFLDGKLLKYGYKNAEGKIIVTAKYAEATDFYKGFATVALGGKWGLINIDGKVVIPIKYDYLPIDELKNGMIPFNLAMSEHNGILDTLGQIVVPSGIYDRCKIAGKNIVIVSKNDLYGVYQAGKSVYQKMSEKTQNIEVGKCTIPVKYSDVYLATDNNRNVIGNLIVVVQHDASGKDQYGLFNYSGKTLIICNKDLIGSFKNGIAPVYFNGSHLSIDTTGSIL